VQLSLNYGAILLPFKPYTIGAYERVFKHSLFLSGFRNTIFVVVVGTSINMFVTVITGYVLSRKGMMLNKMLTFLIIFTMYFSGGLIPGYLNVKDL
jgi:putative aldouronate transport system permease protein